jgi:hypothetical protein
MISFLLPDKVVSSGANFGSFVLRVFTLYHPGVKSPSVTEMAAGF